MAGTNRLVVADTAGQWHALSRLVMAGTNRLVMADTAGLRPRLRRCWQWRRPVNRRPVARSNWLRSSLCYAGTGTASQWHASNHPSSHVVTAAAASQLRAFDCHTYYGRHPSTKPPPLSRSKSSVITLMAGTAARAAPVPAAAAGTWFASVLLGWRRAAVGLARPSANGGKAGPVARSSWRLWPAPQQASGALS